jgi:hypothetical protein
MISQVFKGVVLCRLSQYIGSWLIFGFLSLYPKFWFGKILADLNPIYKIPKLHISSVHLTNFQSSQISPSGTLSIIGTLRNIEDLGMHYVKVMLWFADG